MGLPRITMCASRESVVVMLLFALTSVFWTIVLISDNTSTRFAGQIHFQKEADIRPAQEEVTVTGQDVISKGAAKENTPRCVDPLAVKYKKVEDVYCMRIPDFVPEYKNPCFYSYEGPKRVLKCLPYFYIIGMDKCGTTDLHSRVASHPDVRNNKGSLQKETMFWSWYRYGIHNYKTVENKRTMEDYYGAFQGIATEIQNDPSTGHRLITGDATPMDLWDFRNWDRIPQNFGKKEPEVLTPHMIKYINSDRVPKFLIQLREPVERLYSDYFFLRQGVSPNTFHTHVTVSLAMLQECLQQHGRRYCFFDKQLYAKLPTRIHLGCYSVYIKEWFDVFPRSAFHFSRTEDFQRDMKGTLNSIYSFIQLDPMTDDSLDEIVAQDRKHVTKSKKGTMLPQTFDMLKEFYAPYLQETAEMLQNPNYLWQDVYLKRPKSPPPPPQGVRSDSHAAPYARRSPYRTPEIVRRMRPKLLESQLNR